MHRGTARRPCLLQHAPVGTDPDEERAQPVHEEELDVALGAAEDELPAHLEAVGGEGELDP
eukprot:7883802-Alexandrium_andersonii.AAC.1